MIRRSSKSKKQNKTQRHFKGVWIPKEIWLSADLTWMEKLFIVEIDSLDNGKSGCFASNKHFSEFFNLSTSRCSQIIKSLADKEYIKIKIKRKGKEIIRRSIFINRGVFRILKGGIKYSKGGYLENCKGNNTSYNNTSIEKLSPILDKFEKWYKHYPKKVSKQTAKQAWIKLFTKESKKNQPSFETLLLAVKQQSKSEQWQNKKYIPHPSTWLNQRRWDDEIETRNNPSNYSNYEEETPSKYLKYSDSDERYYNRYDDEYEDPFDDD